MPVAVKVEVKPFATEGAVGVILMLESVAVVTAMLAVGEVIPLNDAATVVLPTATPVATPVLLPIVATPAFADAHVTWLLMSAVVLSV